MNEVDCVVKDETLEDLNDGCSELGTCDTVPPSSTLVGYNPVYGLWKDA